AGAFFEGANVAPFAADDASLHVVAGDVHGANRGVGRVLGGVAMNGRGQDAAGRVFRDRLDVLLVAQGACSGLGGQLVVQPVQEQFFGLLAGVAADLVKQLGLPGDGGVGLLVFSL